MTESQDRQQGMPYPPTASDVSTRASAYPVVPRVSPPVSDPTRKSRGRQSLLILMATVVLAAAAVLVVAVHGPSKSRSVSKGNSPRVTSSISMSSLQLLGGPISADGFLLVINISASHQLDLSAINPATETVVWQRTFSRSGIHPGEGFPPVAFGSTAIALAPTDGTQSAAIHVLGINIPTGSVAWTYSEPGVPDDPGAADDAPAGCAGSVTFCLSWFDLATNNQKLFEIDATNGSLVRSIPQIDLNLRTNLYQVNYPTPWLMQIGHQGQELWEEPTSAVFGSTNDNPNYGWDVDPLGALDVGSLSQSSEQESLDLGTSTTSGFSIATR